MHSSTKKVLLKDRPKLQGFDRNKMVLQAAAEFIIVNYLPIHIVTKDSFRRLLAAANPSIVNIGKDKIRDFIKILDLQRIDSLTTMMKDHEFAITHDG